MIAICILLVCLLLLLFCCIFSSGVSYEEFENPRVVEVEEDKVTHSEDLTKPTDEPDYQDNHIKI